MKKFILALIFFIFIFKNNAFAQRIGFSDEKWKTLQTEHFDVIFPEKQQDLGLYYAQQAEIAYKNLTTVFTNKPERTVIIVNDNTDLSNGYATPIPYAHIMVYSVPVGEQDVLSESGEWGKELITHEMTHILQLEPALGAYRYLRPIFGSIIAPNLLMPLWWKEGMAVEMETQFSAQGRLRSHYQDATLRAMVLDKTLFQNTLAKANEVLPSWPYGGRPYLFGSIFWHSLVKDTNIQAIDKITSHQGRRVPYFVEAPMNEVSQKNYEGQYSKALYEIDHQAKKQIELLKTQTLTNFQTLNITGHAAYNPKWSESFKLLAYLEQKDSEQEIIILNSQLEKLRLKNLPTGVISSLSFYPSEKKIIFAKAEQKNSKQKFSDLYTYNIETDQTEQLTFNERAREPSFSDDGKTIFYISTFNGKTQIKSFNLNSKLIETLAESDFEHRYQSPLYWKNQNNEEFVLVSKRDSLGKQKLHIIHLRNKTESVSSLNFQNIKFLRKSQSNDIYFTSSENGVFNIYVTKDLQTASPITNSLTGIWSYDIDSTNKKIWVAAMSSTGFKIYSAPLETRTSPLAKIKTLTEGSYNNPKNLITNPTASSTKISPEDYSAGSYLWPQYWIPFISTGSSSKGVYLQAQTSGHDPIKIHEYALQANYDTALEKGGFTGFYTNSSLPVPVQISALLQSKYLGDITNTVETQTAAISLLPDIFSLNKNLTLQAGIELQTTEWSDVVTEFWGPYIQLTYLNYSQNVFSISPESGWAASLKYESLQQSKKVEYDTNSQDYNRTSASLVGYFSPWLPEHHAILIKASGLHIAEEVGSRYGIISESNVLLADSPLPQFILRGYQASQFYGRKAWNVNMEYRFPLFNIEKGSGTDPFFMKRLSAAIITDGLAVEGGSYTADKTYENRKLDESFWSSGLELKLDTTVGYVIPMKFILGVYFPSSSKFSNSPQTGLGLQLGGF